MNNYECELLLNMKVNIMNMNKYEQTHFIAHSTECYGSTATYEYANGKETNLATFY